jgi:hypothetical protein
MSYDVWYQTGGSLNFRWRMQLHPHATLESAGMSKDMIERAGYPVKILEHGSPAPTEWVDPDTLPSMRRPA